MSKKIGWHHVGTKLAPLGNCAGEMQLGAVFERWGHLKVPVESVTLTAVDLSEREDRPNRRKIFGIPESVAEQGRQAIAAAQIAMKL